eukprot:530374-Hanusia_phi.AAC.1
MVDGGMEGWRRGGRRDDFRKLIAAGGIIENREAEQISRFESVAEGQIIHDLEQDLVVSKVNEDSLQ